MNINQISNDEYEQTNLSNPNCTSDIIQTKEVLLLNHVPQQLHSAQQEINNLRLLNVCLQSTLLRVQIQLIEYTPENTDDEIKRNNTKQQLALLRQTDDHSRRVIHHQQISFFQNLFENKQQEPVNTKHISLLKSEKQIEILHDMFYELNTIIHTEHNDRICQLYITLAQTSHSVLKARDVLDKTIHTQRILTRRKIKRKVFLIFIIFTFISIIIFFIILSIRIH